MVYDDLCASESEFLRAFFDFLGVDADFESSHVGQDINPDPDDVWDFVSPQVRAELAEVYRPDVEELSTMLGRDLSHWLDVAPGDGLHSDEGTTEVSPFLSQSPS
jgi:hypothetical protein